MPIEMTKNEEICILINNYIDDNIIKDKSNLILE